MVDGLGLTERQQDAIQQLGLTTVELGASLGPCTRLGVGGGCGALVTGDSEAAALLGRWTRRERLKLTTITRGANLLVREGGLAGVVLLEEPGEDPEDDPLPGVPLFLDPEQGSTAGELLDRSGLLGVRIRGVRIAADHPNRLVTEEGARAQDVEVLVDLARARIAAQWGVELTPAVTMVGRSIPRSAR